MNKLLAIIQSTHYSPQETGKHSYTSQPRNIMEHINKKSCYYQRCKEKP